MRFKLILLGWLFSYAFLKASLALAQGDEQTLRTIINDWHSRQINTSTISYHLSGVEFIPKGTLNRMLDRVILGTDDPLPEKDAKNEIKIKWLIDCQKGMVRKDYWFSRFFIPTRTSFPTYRIFVWDGVMGKVYQPKKENTSTTYVPGDLDTEMSLVSSQGFAQTFEGLDYPILFAHGLYPFGGIRNVKVKEIKPSYDLKAFKVQGNAIVDSRPCVVLSATSENGAVSYTDHIWVDIERGSVVRRWTRNVDESPRVQIDMLFQDPPNDWLPKSWRVTSYLPKDLQIQKTYEIVVTSYALDKPIDDENFQVDMNPGMVINKEDGKNYRVKSDGKSLAEIPEEEYLNPPGRDAGIVWWIVGLAIMGSFFLLVLKRKKM